MADPLSITASIITVLQLAGSVATLCLTYRDATKSKDGVLHQLLDELKGLTNILDPLAKFAKDHGGGTRSLEALNEPEGALDECRVLLEKLQTELESFVDAQGVKKLSKILVWPIKEKEVQSLLKRLSQRKSTLALALHQIQIENGQDLGVRITAVNDFLVSSQADGKRNKALRWLNVGDSSISYAEACKKRQSGTGTWFLTGSEYAAWKVNHGSLLWLHGIPGCGKTVLSSTIIEDLVAYTSAATGIGLAYFYFDFSDVERQSVRSLISSLISQLSGQSPVLPNCVEALYDKYEDCGQQPRERDLKAALEVLIESFPHVYLVLDALDECSEREELMQSLDELLSKSMDGLHLLTTSRKEQDIEDAFDNLRPVKISLAVKEVNEDIKLHIKSRLSQDLRLKRLAEATKAEIETALLDGAHGMYGHMNPFLVELYLLGGYAQHFGPFRQLDALRECRKPASIRRALTSLPKDLDETYARTLVRIQKSIDGYEDAYAALQWLAIAARPLTLREVAEAVAISPGCAAIDEDNRLFEPKELLSICSSLVTLSGDSETDRLRLTHFSVKEYLLSGRIQTGPASAFAVEEVHAHKFISKICLTYLLTLSEADAFMAPEFRDAAANSDPNMKDRSSDGKASAWSAKRQSMTPKMIFGSFPLLRYAARYWSKHVRALPSDEAAEVDDQILELMNPTRNASFLNWLRASNPTLLGQYNFATEMEDLRPPLYYGAILGLAGVVQTMLRNGADVHGRNIHDLDLNARCSPWRSPLHAAVARGHESVVRILLSFGADIHTEDEIGRTPLQVACDHGRRQIIDLLLQEGADVNHPGDSTSQHAAPPLLAAASHDDKGLIMLLLENGADINAQSGFFGNALQEACRQGHNTVVELLIAKGACVNSRGGWYDNALQAAATLGDETVCNTLLRHGADVNAMGGRYGTALQVACNGNENIVRLLIDHLADVNAQGGMYGTALKAACAHKRESVIKLLLENGADVNLDGAGMGTPLQTAAATGNKELFKQFLEMGANIEASTGSDGSPLQISARWEHDTMVDLILAKGAMVNTAASGKFGFPLQAVAFAGNVAIARKLLDVGSEIHATGGKYGTALIAAAFCGHQDMIHLLLDSGADVNAIGGKYGTALFAAAFTGRYQTAHLLLDNGADVDMSTYAGNPLGAAMRGWKAPHESVIELLEKHGATDALMPADVPEDEGLDTDVDLSEFGEGDYLDAESVALSGEL
ncbi:MAG: hypothetical protein M1830_000055 [Pleopsidium flavum]|nr:MAG: hypothetical protein M1830_000055 [Pleopsidium flavum]